MMRGLILCLTLTISSQLEAQTNGGYGASLPSTCVVGSLFVKSGASAGVYYCSATDTWTAVGGGGDSVPAGAIIFIDSGTCPAGYAEASDLSGKTIIGTVAANKDVGTTGGSDTITPAGTNSAPAIAWPAGVPTFAGQAITFTEVINHTHAVTSVGSAATGSTTNLTGSSDTSSTTATAANPAGGVASFQKTPAGTISWPAGVPTQSAATFTGTQFDNRSAWVKLIACKKT